MTRSRIFQAVDQEAFAALSGDWNPLHMDPLAARRTMFGRPVVHGIHTVLWAIEEWAAGRPGRFQMTRLKAAFRKPAGVGETVGWEPKQETGESVRLAVSGTTIDLYFHGSAGADGEIPGGRVALLSPALHTAETIASAAGSLPLRLDRELTRSLFPSLGEKVPAWQLAVIIATTTVVGMHCPGLYSVFSELDLRFGDGPGGGALSYRVKSYDERFRLITILVEGQGVTGTLKAFLRPAPQEQPGFAELRALVGPEEFLGRKALVVGGSRGLGEVTAKLLAAGGADVRLTYHRGESDARRVVEEIRGGGGGVDCFALDVRHPRIAGGWAPTDLYYLATPFIFGATAGVFQEPIFHTFCDYYVTGFQNMVGLLLPGGLQRVFYPSSVALDELPSNMFEYVAAKAAGEATARYLERQHPGLRIHSSRLPRLATDQTAAVMPVENQDPVGVLLRELRALHGN